MYQSTLSAMLRTTTVVGAVISFAGQALANNQGVIDVPEQELMAAIEELSEQTGRPIAVSLDAVGTVKSHAVRGPMTAKRALENMIGDHQVSVQELNDGSLIVTRNAALSLVSQNATDEEPFELGTLILLGERVERDVFDTASSVEAFDGGTIDANPQNNDLEAVFANVANITTGTGNTAPHIRGVNSAGEISGGALGAAAGTLPRATVTIDGRNLTPNEAIYGTTSVFDTEAVEVFRGPQTTSQGANAIAGAINLRTRNPVFEREASARAEIASDNGRAASVMFNAPLSESVAARFVYDLEEQDLYFDYDPGVPAIEEARKQRQETARLKLLLEPVAVPGLSTQLTFSYTEFSGPQNQSLRMPFDDLRSFGTGAPPAFIGDTRGIVHDFEYDLGGGFVLRNQFQYAETDSVRTFGLGAASDFPQRFVDRSNETLLEYAPEGSSFSGLIGVYARETKESSPGSVQFTLEGERSGFGVFGEFTQRFQNGLDVTAGLRYQENDQTREVAPFGFPVSLVDFDGSFDAFLPKLTIGYEPTDNTRFAFQVSRGYNPGGIAIVLTDLTPYEFEDETVINYELSIRHRSPDGRWFVGANLFYSDYRDYQLFVNQQVPPTGPLGTTQAGRLFNVDDVTTYGLEANAIFDVNDDLRLNGSLGLLRTDTGDLGSEIEEFTGSTSRNGNDLPLAPSTTLSLGADYRVTDRFTVGAQLNYTSSYFSDVTNEEELKVGDFAIVDVRAAYKLTERAELYGYVNNVFDSREETNLFRVGGTISGGSITPPREIGFGLRATF